MTIVVMQASGTGIRTILTSMILRRFLYVVAVGKNVRGMVLISQVFFIFTKNWHQHFTPRVAFMRGFLAGEGREDKTEK